jgi:hypothetical protein
MDSEAFVNMISKKRKPCGQSGGQPAKHSAQDALFERIDDQVSANAKSLQKINQLQDSFSSTITTVHAEQLKQTNLLTDTLEILADVKKGIENGFATFAVANEKRDNTLVDSNTDSPTDAVDTEELTAPATIAHTTTGKGLIERVGSLERKVCSSVSTCALCNNRPNCKPRKRRS